MNPNLFIRYKGADADSDSQISLAEIGESLSGFHSVLENLSEIAGITIRPTIEVTALREGSVIFDIVSSWGHSSTVLPFDSVDSFLEFIRLAEVPGADRIEEYFNELGSAHRSLNDWAAQNPVDFEAVKSLWHVFWAGVIIKLFAWAGFFKKGENPQNKKVSRRKQRALQRLVKKKGFKKALTPLTEDKARSIELSDKRDFSRSAVVDQTNMEDYLADEDMILPHLENGTTHELHGTITSLKATRGDQMTLQIKHDGDSYNLDALPAPGLTTKNYIDFYTEDVNVRAEVMRTSLYKKPKLRLHSIALRQMELGLKLDSTPAEKAAREQTH